ncbi:hypothetical protein FRC12_001192 [Ceratobasidium sp. 428]|nr:hypothetical protein FRC12_001192 [Ceratobasidium sp. 428]
MYMLAPGGPKGVKRDAARACDSPEGCLVFCSIWSTPLPEPIRNKEFDSIIHVGWVYNSDRYNEVIDTNGLRRATLILTQEEFDEEYLSQVELKQVGYDPCRATDSYNSLESNAKLSAMREQWKDELGGHYGTLCRCFEVSLVAVDIRRPPMIFARHGLNIISADLMRKPNGMQ